MGGTPAPLAPYTSHKHVYKHTEISPLQVDLSGGAAKYSFQTRVNILCALKPQRAREASRES